MAGKLDGIDKRLDSATQRMQAIEDRQDAMNTKINRFSGALALISAAGSAALTLFGKRLAGA